MRERQTLVLLCGIGEDEAIWTAVAAPLSDVAECVPMVANGDSIDAMAADVLARTDGALALAGHSLGGYVALAAQRAAPDRVRRLALLNTSTLPDDDTARDNRRRLIARIDRDGLSAVAPTMIAALGAPVGQPDATDAETMLLRTGATRFMRDQHAAMTRPDARPALAAIAVPVLVIGSADDRVVPAARSSEIAATIPDATLVMLPDTGHFSPIESPGPIADAMRIWLTV